MRSLIKKILREDFEWMKDISPERNVTCDQLEIGDRIRLQGPENYYFTDRMGSVVKFDFSDYGTENILVAFDEPIYNGHNGGEGYKECNNNCWWFLCGEEEHYDFIQIL